MWISSETTLKVHLAELGESRAGASHATHDCQSVMRRCTMKHDLEKLAFLWIGGSLVWEWSEGPWLRFALDQIRLSKVGPFFTWMQKITQAIIFRFLAMCVSMQQALQRRSVFKALAGLGHFGLWLLAWLRLLPLANNRWLPCARDKRCQFSKCKYENWKLSKFSYSLSIQCKIMSRY